MKVAFLGLGIMGSRMAKNLLTHQVNLTVWNRSPEASQALKETGAKVAPTVGEAVADADIVITMLSKPEAVTEVMMGEEGGLSKMKEGSLWMDSSTVNPSFSRMQAAEASDRNIRFIDAPVAGTLPHAQNAELVFFIGGSEADMKEAEPYMNMMGKKVMHVGAISMGASFKMLVNSMLAQSMLMFSETVLLGEKLGLDTGFLLNTLPNLVVAPPFLKAKTGMMESNEYPVMFPLEHMHKDMHLATQCGYEVGLPLPFANMAKERYADAVQAGLGRLDFAAIHQFLQK